MTDGLLQKDVLIIIPAFNEGEYIGPLLDELKNSDVMDIADVLVINDASNDNTEQIVRSRGIDIVSNVYNLGYGNALLVGYSYAYYHGYKYVIQMDGDGQHDLSNIMKIYKRLETCDACGRYPDIVLGSRFADGWKDYPTSGIKKFAYKLFRSLIKMATGRTITDPTTGLQGLNRRTLEYYIGDGNFDDKYPDANMIMQMLMLGYNIVEIKALMHKRVSGKSMHSKLKPALYMMRMGWSVTAVWIRFGMRNALFKRTKVNFKKEIQPESNERLLNPDRGWYRIFPFIIGNPADWESIQYSLNDNEKLVLVRIDIGNFSADELSTEALNEIRGILNYFCNHDKDIILRVTYDSEGCSMEREPSLSSIVVSHMEQLSKIVNEYGDRIFIYQGLLIGNWGEMHSSRYASEKYLKSIYQKAPETCFVSVRTPQIHRSLYSGNNRLGLFNDAIFASENDLGTYKSPEDRDYESKTGLFAPGGGEAVYGDGFSERLSAKEILGSMGQRHITYLNIQYDRKLLDKWQQDEELFTTISNKLGYRYVVRDAFFDKKTSSLVIKVQNVGFAPIYRKTETKLIIVDDNNEKTEIQTDMNLMEQDADGNISVSVALQNELSELKGKVYLRTVRSFDGCRILYANEGCTDGDVYLGRIS